MITKHSGFAVLESLLILVIIGIIGGTGYFVWHSKQQADKTLTNSSSLKNSPSLKSNKNYLVIKEWGIRMKLSPDITDAVYKYKVGKDIGYGKGAADLSTLTLQKMFSECEFGTILKAAGSDIYDPDSAYPNMTVEQANKTLNGSFKKVGNYYYELRLAEGLYCINNPPPADGGQMSPEEMRARTAMVNAFDSIEATP